MDVKPLSVVKLHSKRFPFSYSRSFFMCKSVFCMFICLLFPEFLFLSLTHLLTLYYSLSFWRRDVCLIGCLAFINI